MVAAGPNAWGRSECPPGRALVPPAAWGKDGVSSLEGWSLCLGSPLPGPRSLLVAGYPPSSVQSGFPPTFDAVGSSVFLSAGGA